MSKMQYGKFLDDSHNLSGVYRKKQKNLQSETNR